MRAKQHISRPPRLTDHQRKQLATLEPALRNAARRGDYPGAERVTKQIQVLLRPTGHETRLMQAKNWLFEAALGAGKVETAISGFIGVRKKTNIATRANLEATALLAICYLRSGNTEKAKPLMKYVLREDKCITSVARRRQFRQRIVARFNQETALAALRDTGDEKLNVDDIEKAAGELVRTKTEDKLFEALGTAIPPEVIIQILEVDQFSRRALPYQEIKYLPSPDDLKKKKEVGRTVFSAFKTALYRSLCDPKSEVYQAWSREGMGVVLNRKYIGAAVAALCVDLRIGIMAVAVPVVALIVRFGIDVYCERFKPQGIMIDRKEK